MPSPYNPSPVMLSSVEKIAFYLGIDAGKGRVNGNNSDTQKQRDIRRVITQWVYSISTDMQNYCFREFLILPQPRVQFFDVLGTQEFWPRAVPVVSIVEISNDPLGLFQGDQWTLQESIYHLSQTGRSIQMVYNVMTGGWNAARITYNGGLAYDATKSTFTVVDVTGVDNILPGYFAYGLNSESIGKVVSITSIIGSSPQAYTLVLDNVYGTFQTEDLTFQSTYQAQDIPTTGATISAITQQSLCEAFPNLNRAVEIEADAMIKRQGNFEVQVEGGARTGTNYRKPADSPDGYIFQQETRGILDRDFKRVLVGS